MASNVVTIQPQPGPQTYFFRTPADIVIYGGQAGSGKSWCLAAEPLRHVKNANFSAVLFRRTYKQIMNPGGLWDEASALYPRFGGVARQTDGKFTFEAGSTVQFAHLQHESNKLNWQGAQIPLIEFDEVTHFSESQFFYLMSRNRSLSGVRPYMRATCNPDADSWVAKFVDWWIDDAGYADRRKAGVMRWFIRKSGTIVWRDTKEELEREFENSRPKSFTFIPAKLSDNKILEEADPDYRANLEALPPVERERLLEGNWRIRESAGKVMHRDWFKITEDVPRGGVDVRCWDMAATVKELEGDDPDYTASVRMRFFRGNIYILDVTDSQVAPAEVDEMIDTYSAQDQAECYTMGIPYMVRWEQEPAGAGKRETWRLATRLYQYDAAGIPSQGDKITRIKPFAAQARVGNVYLKKAYWNDHYMQHMHSQPDWPHDDIMDATSGAYLALIDQTGVDAMALAFEQ